MIEANVAGLSLEAGLDGCMQELRAGQLGQIAVVSSGNLDTIVRIDHEIECIGIHRSRIINVVNIRW